MHGLVEYAGAVLFLVAPFVLDFDSDAATAASILVGLLVLVVAATTAGPTGIIRSIPVPAHVVLDYALAGVLVAAPFVFGFSDEGAPTAFFVVLGVLHLLVSIATRYLPARRAAA